MYKVSAARLLYSKASDRFTDFRSSFQDNHLHTRAGGGDKEGRRGARGAVGAQP